MGKREHDAWVQISKDLFPPLNPSFKDGLMEIEDPEILRDEIINVVKGKEGFEQIEQVLAMAFKGAANHKPRKEGKPYIIHPLRVTWRLLDYWQQMYNCLPSPDDVYAAALHDVLEDSLRVSAEEIELTINKPVRGGVETLTKQYKHKNIDKSIKGKRPEEYFAGIRKKSANKQIHVKLIKVLDRTDNMWSLYPYMPQEFIESQLAETRLHVLPMAREFPFLYHDLENAMSRFGPRREQRKKKNSRKA